MKIVVIGGGAAGLLAAGKAAETADEVVIIEKNDIIGKKLLITGKGRCNITNSADIEDMIGQYPRNAKFLYSALYTFTNDDIIRIIEENGVKTKVERGGRVFPVSDKSQDVVKALKKYALKPNVSLVHDTVKSLIISDGTVKGVKTSKTSITADRVIICTGGKSYPRTGSTGDGYKFAKQAGHTIIEPKASLIPVLTEEKFVKDIMGLSLRNIKITAFNQKNKKVYSDFGEMLFTHFGISGPLALSLSSLINRCDLKSVELYLDLKPALDEGTLDKRLLRDFEKYKNKQLANAMTDLLPQKMIGAVLSASGVSEKKSVNVLTKEERGMLIKTLKGFLMKPLSLRGFEEAIITSGGVALSEINPKTLESKKIKGLRFCGEVLDVDAFTGGYNLQIAFSTGYAAGKSIKPSDEGAEKLD